MRKSISTILASIFLVSLTISGCAETTEKKQEEKAAVKLTIAWWGSQTRHEYTNKLLAMYTAKHPNVTFQAKASGWDGYFDKLSAQAAGNTMPDIIQMDYSYISTFTQNETLADLSSFANDKTIDLSNADTNLIDTGKVGSKFTGIVLGSTALAMIYNPQVYAKAGLSAPPANWTWRDFEKDMLTIKEKTGSYGISKIDNISTFPYWVRQYGKSLYSSDGTKLGYEDDKVFIEYAQMLQRLQEAKAMPNPDEWAQMSANGKEAETVVTGASGITLDVANFGVIVSRANPNLKLVTPPYSGTRIKALWNKPSMFFSVSKSSENQKAAAEFINWFLNDEEANKIIRAERGIPISSKIRESLKASLTAQQKDMFDYAETVIENSSKADQPEPPGVSEVNKVLVEAINLVLYNKKSAEKAAADFRIKANEILSRNTE
jgi:multiple sugar transport system substrate-binding protein